MTFKAIHCAAPEYIINMFKQCNNENYQMRSNRHKLILDKPNKNFMKKSFSYRVELVPGITYPTTSSTNTSNYQLAVLKPYSPTILRV